MGIQQLTRQNLSVSAPTFATVGVGSAQVLARNTARRGVVLVNTSANRISLAFGSAAAVLDSGITLYGLGGSWSMDELAFTLDAISAIASGAGSNLAIQEFSV